MSMKKTYIYIKRFFDCFLSSLLLLLVSPVFFILMILVWINLGRPIFFMQERTGKNLSVFKMIKFRTMNNKKNAKGELLPDEMRVTKLGAFLRSTSLDELPELLNIIRGDMSIVGPRPLHSRYDKYYSIDELKRFKVRGGLIPPDSVDMSPTITWEKQFMYEIDYAENVSFVMDLKIFFNVFKILFSRNRSDYGVFVRPALDKERQFKNKNYE